MAISLHSREGRGLFSFARSQKKVVQGQNHAPLVQAVRYPKLDYEPDYSPDVLKNFAEEGGHFFAGTVVFRRGAFLDKYGCDTPMLSDDEKSHLNSFQGSLQAIARGLKVSGDPVSERAKFVAQEIQERIMDFRKTHEPLNSLHIYMGTDRGVSGVAAYIAKGITGKYGWERVDAQEYGLDENRKVTRVASDATPHVQVLCVEEHTVSSARVGADGNYSYFLVGTRVPVKRR